MSDAADDTREGGFILVDAPTCNVVGAYVIAGYALVLALYLGSCVFTRWLASRGKMPEVAAGKLRLAAATGRVDMMVGIKKSLGALFDIDCDVLGFTALHAAVCQGELGAVLWLLQNGADVEKVKEDGWKNTAMHYAASRGNQERHQEVVRVLFAYGARLDRENFAGETAAQTAANMGHRLISRLMNDLGAGNLSQFSSFPSQSSAGRASTDTAEGGGGGGGSTAPYASGVRLLLLFEAGGPLDEARQVGEKCRAGARGGGRGL